MGWWGRGGNGLGLWELNQVSWRVLWGSGLPVLGQGTSVPIGFLKREEKQGMDLDE